MSIEPLKWCEERLLVPGHPLMATLGFVDSERRARILALRALITEIASVSELSHEPALAEAKLAWWREALVERRPHPAIDALMMNSDLTAKDMVIELLGLCDQVEATLEPKRHETTAAAWHACAGIGGLPARLEYQLLSGASPSHTAEQNVATLGTAGYWFRLVRDLPADAHQNRWFVPLEVQADYQISRQAVLRGPPVSAWEGMVRTLLSHAMREAHEARTALLAMPDIATRHLLILYAVDERLAQQLFRWPSRLLSRRVLPSHAGNVWVAWRTARRLERAG